MKRLSLLVLLSFLGFALMGPVGLAFANSCTASIEDAKPAQALKVDAKKLRDEKDFAGAAAKYLEAAAAMPMTPVAISYKMNAVGCLLCEYFSYVPIHGTAGGYQWGDGVRGVQNAEQAYKILDAVLPDLEWCEANKCKCDSAPVGKTRAWYDAQLAWLEEHAPRKAKK